MKENEKQAIEEMAYEIETRFDFLKSTCYSAATALYIAGYRKQKEGEWLFAPTMIRTPSAINYTCSACDCESARITPFCSNCGAKMKGGAE